MKWKLLNKKTYKSEAFICTKVNNNMFYYFQYYTRQLKEY